MMPSHEDWMLKIANGRDRISHFFHHVEEEQLIDAPSEVIEELKRLSWRLWQAVMNNPPRTLVPLSMDCCYIVCKMTGYRISVRRMREIALLLFEKPIRILATPKRTKKKWPLEERYAEMILHIIDDSDAYEDMVSEW